MTVEVDTDCNELNSKDLLKSIISNTFFLFAGIFAVASGLWELFPDSAESNYRSLYVLECLEPISYLINSIIDVHLAQRILQLKKSRRKEIASAAQNKSNQQQQQQRVLWTKVRKHAAHRRDVYAAMAFLIAAFFGTISALFDVSDGIAWIDADYRLDLVDVFDFLSIHFYMLSAMLAIIGSGLILQMVDFNDVDSLENMGDLVFLLGSILDMILCDFHFDDDVIWWELLSAFLWCFDALFYLRSDFISRRSLNKTNTGELLLQQHEQHELGIIKIY